MLGVFLVTLLAGLISSSKQARWTARKKRLIVYINGLCGCN